jgi:ParB family chromosome partitioning protein
MIDKQKNTKSVLGKGLASLLPNAGQSSLNASYSSGSVGSNVQQKTYDSSLDSKDRLPGITMVPVAQIKAGRFQPRTVFDDQTIEELANSIKANGVVQPLVVRKSVDGFELIAGERRLRAAQKAGLMLVPVIVKRLTDKEALEIAIIENVQREDLNCIDAAQGYHQLMVDFNLTQEEIAERIGKDRASIANYLRLLKLPEKVKELLKNKKLTYGHGRALMGLDDAKMIEKLADKIIIENLSVRQIETIVQSVKNSGDTIKLETQQRQNLNNQDQERLLSVSKELSTKLSTKVEIKGSGKKGKIIIQYHSTDNLNTLIDKLLK